jgi:hypothetical protein
MVKKENIVRTQTSRVIYSIRNIFAKNWVLICIILIGAILRFYRIDHFDLWYDEVSSVKEAADIARFISGLNFITLAPLYFILLALWIKLVGLSVFSLRLFSALPACFSIILIYLITRDYYDKKTGLLSALFLALSPLHIWYAQEVRMYSISVFVCLVMLYTGMKLQEKQNFFLLTCFLFIAIIAVYLNYFSIFVLLPFLALQYDKNLFIRKSNQIGFAIFGICILPCVLLALRQVNNIKDSFWTTAPQIIDLNIAVANLIVGYNGTLLAIITAIFLMFILICIALIKEPKDEKYWFFVCCGIIPVIFIFIFSQFVPVFTVKTLIIFTPFIYLLLIRGGLAIYISWIRLLTFVMVLGIMGLSLPYYYKGIMPASERFNVGVQPKANIKKAASYIKSQSQPGDIIAHSNPHTLFPFIYALQAEKNILQMYLQIPEKQQDKYWKKVYALDEKPARPPAKIFTYLVKRLGSLPVLYPRRRMWLISSDWRIDGLIDNHALAVRQQAMLRFKKVQTAYINNMHIDLFLMDQHPILNRKQ